MAYLYSTPPPHRDIVWIKLIKPYPNDIWKSNFPKDMNVGDITWVDKSRWGSDDKHCLFEGNRYRGNFNKDVFSEVKSKSDLIEEAKKRFPIDTVFSNENLGYSCRDIKVTGEGFNIDWDGRLEIKPGNTNKSGSFTVYRKGVWAQITSLSIPKNTLKVGDQIKIGKYMCKVRKSLSHPGCYYLETSSGNSFIFTQFGITFEELSKQTKTYSGVFPQTESLEDLQILIDYIITISKSQSSIDGCSTTVEMSLPKVSKSLYMPVSQSRLKFELTPLIPIKRRPII